ncbi:MAG: zinc ribbon domain-containing protein YjdM [Eubacteriales bacterium]|nr:zinc ribbon domain-containing protein YjdM [Eubacteriales bacterium]
MEKLENCPKCNSEYTYEVDHLLHCPECFHEWNPEIDAAKEAEREAAKQIRDANGNILADGDTVSVIQDLKLKANMTIKRGTIVKNIRLIENPSDGIHNIDCKIDGFGDMLLKSSVVKKV